MSLDWEGAESLQAPLFVEEPAGLDQPAASSVGADHIQTIRRTPGNRVAVEIVCVLTRVRPDLDDCPIRQFRVLHRVGVIVTLAKCKAAIQADVLGRFQGRKRRREAPDGHL